jgi:CspA family cold shock protein
LTGAGAACISPRAHAGFGELRPQAAPNPDRNRFCRAAALYRARRDAIPRKSLKGEINVRTTGTVKFYNEAKGYGFLTRDDGSGDVFVHRTDLSDGIALLYEGQAVSFDIETTRRGLRAVNIALVG